MSLTLPAMLKLPPKLMPLISEFNENEVFVIDGGRSSGKTQSVARILLYLGDKKKLRIVCGRELISNIEESVYTVFKDLILLYQLPYNIHRYKITHKWTGSEITFKGFREQGNVSIKGLEGVDILWIDEAQSIQHSTLAIIMPTIRKDDAKVFFTMNRFLREDSVPEYFKGKVDCLDISINYYENPFCPLSIKIQAEDMRRKSMRDYKHIWLGEPLTAADDYLFNFDKLHASLEIVPIGEAAYKQRVLGIDFAAQGDDDCVAIILDRVTNQHWQIADRIVWDEPDTTVSIGKIVNIIGQYKPDASVLDIGGMGKPIWDRINEVLKNSGQRVDPFDGGSTGVVDTGSYANLRAQSYYKLKDWFDDGFLSLGSKDMEIIKELERIKFKYRSNGVRLIQSKVDMKAEMKYSPDNADALMMAVYCATNCLGGKSNAGAMQRPITLKNKRRR